MRNLFEVLKISFLNLRRHRWKARLIFLVTFVASFSVLATSNLIQDLYQKQSAMYSRAFAGHFLIINKKVELNDTLGLYAYEPRHLIPEDEVREVTAYLKNLPEVDGCEERIVAGGVLYDEDNAEKFVPVIATDFSGFARNFTGRSLQEGSFKPPVADAFGAYLPKNMVAGSQSPPKLALGHPYVAMLPNRHGEYVDRELKLQARVAYEEVPEELSLPIGCLFLDLASYRNWAGFARKEASDIVGFLRDTREERPALRRIQAYLDQNHPTLSVVSWKAYAPLLGETTAGLDAVFKGVNAMLLLICFFLIWQVVTFAVYERLREIGTLRAMGFSSLTITGLFTLETMAAILSGVAAGTIAVLLLLSHFGKVGIHADLSLLLFLFGRDFYPSIHFRESVEILICFFLLSLAGPLLPALSVHRFSIVQALEER